MKYLIGILLLLLMQTATAGECRVNGGTWQSVVHGSILTFSVPVRAAPGAGRIDLNGYRLECRYTPGRTTPSWRIDYWDTVSAYTFIPGPKISAHITGLRISNTDYPKPVPYLVRIATIRDNRVAVDLQTFIYIIKISGQPLNIRKGDRLGTLLFRQTNNTVNPDAEVTFYINADNDFIATPSTCTINGNRPIDVNFGEVDPARIGEAPSSSPIQKVIRLNYSCPDAGITMPVKITFRGQVSSFNSSLLSMSNLNLGTGLLRAGGLVGPEQSFLTNIRNSTGADDVTFSLVRRPGSVPATGAFTGSATLVMGVP